MTTTLDGKTQVGDVVSVLEKDAEFSRGQFLAPLKVRKSNGISV